MAAMQHCEVLENVLQCPVCLDLPKSTPIHQCMRGHHICDSCYQRICNQRCPVCKTTYFGTRNFIAEELIKCLPTSSSEPTVQTNEAEVQVIRAPPLCRGQFPCLFDDCNKNLGAGRMLQHIRDHHGSFLTELPARNEYTQNWNFPSHSRHVEAIRIANMGLFFLVLEKDEKGLLHAAVQMVASNDVAAKFKFKMQISDEKYGTKLSFEDQVFCCCDKFSHRVLQGRCLEFNTRKFSYLKESLICSVSIIDERQ